MNSSDSEMRYDRLTVGEHSVHFIFWLIERKIRKFSKLNNVLKARDNLAKTSLLTFGNQEMILVSS